MTQKDSISINMRLIGMIDMRNMIVKIKRKKKGKEKEAGRNFEARVKVEAEVRREIKKNIRKARNIRIRDLEINK